MEYKVKTKLILRLSLKGVTVAGFEVLFNTDFKHWSKVST